MPFRAVTAMRFEKLDRRVTLEQPVYSVDADSGQKIESSFNSFSVWAQIDELRGKENFEAHREIGEGAAVCVIRYREDIDHDWRVTDERGRKWNIKGVPREIGRREALELALELRK